MSKIISIVLGMVLVVGAGLGLRFLTAPSATPEIADQPIVDLEPEVVTTSVTASPISAEAVKKEIAPAVVTKPKTVSPTPVVAPKAVAPTPAPAQVAPAPTPSVVAPKTVTVTYENNSFNPPVVNLKKGDTIKFINKHSASIRIPSNQHPFHTSYPKLDSGTLDPGESYSLVMDEVAEIHYHNHFNPSVEGTIIVNE